MESVNYRIVIRPSLVHRIVEYVRMRVGFDSEIWWNIEDVDDDVSGILVSFGIVVELSECELVEVRSQFRGMAAREQLREVSKGVEYGYPLVFA